MISTWKRGGGVLKFVKRLHIFIAFEKKIYYSIWQLRWLWVTQLVILHGCHKCLTPQNGLKLQPIQLLEAAVSSSASS